MTKAQKSKLIAALQVELEAAKATKEAAREAGDEAMFDDVVHRIHTIECSIHYVSSPRYKIDARTAELVANNVD